MKKTIRILSAWLIAALLASAAFPAAHALDIYQLPGGITSIESEAFAETQFPESVFIPGECVYIAPDAFPNPSALTVYGFPGSAAQDYCEASGARFVSVQITDASLTAPAWSSPFVPVVFTASAVSGGTLSYRFTLLLDGEAVFESPESESPEFSYAFSEGGSYTATVTVKSRYAETQAVLGAPVTVAQPIKTQAREVFLSVGDQFTPVCADEERPYTLSSSDSEGIGVSGNTVSALKLGKYTVTAAAETPEGRVITPITVHVIIEPETVAISAEAKSAMEGESVAFSAAVSPAEATYSEIVWSVSDPEIARIDAQGVLTALKQGRVTVYARSANVQGEYAFTVTRAVEALEIDAASVPETVLTQDRFRLSCAALPESADNTSVTWTSLNESVLTVHPFTGEVAAVAPGAAVVRALANDLAGAKAEIEITVLQGASQISFESEAAFALPGEAFTVSAEVLPENAHDKTLVWSSSNEAVAVVSDDGAVTCLAPGECRITATASNGVSGSLALTVAEAVESVECLHSNVYMTPGTTLSAAEELVTVKPANALNAELSWSSGNPDIVHADEKTGVLSAIRAGSCVIQAQTANGKSASFTVHSVTDSTVITNIALSPAYGILTVGATGVVTPTASPSGKYMGGVWKVDNEDVLSIVSVDSYKRVTVKAVAPGHATLTFVANSGVTASCPVVVNPIAATSVTMNASSLSLNVGDAFPLAVACQPGNVTNSDAVWYSSNPGIVYVSQTGMLQAVKGGSCIISATLEDGARATCTVTVKNVPMTGATFLQPEITGNAGETYLPEYTFTPENATPAAFVWTSANSRIASVDPITGRIRFLNAGATEITAAALDGSGVTLTLSVTVTETPVTSFSVSESALTLNLQEKITLSTRVLPKDASFAAPVFTSSDEKIASVTQEGVVTAHSEGECTLTVTVGRGAYRFTERIPVTVLPVNDVTYRALIIGQFTAPQADGYLPFANNGTRGVRDALSRSVIDGHRYQITRLGGNPMPASISAAIGALADQADENDVTVVYFLTHGGYSASTGYYMQTSSGRNIMPAEMINALKGVSGHVVLILCTCNSGYIFDSSAAKALVSNNGIYTGQNGEGRLSILCASTDTLSSYYRIMDEAVSYDFYSYAATRAFGWNMLTDGALGAPLADRNGDGRVTLSEYAAYTRGETQRSLSAYIQKNGKTAFSGNVNQFPTWRFAEGEDDLVIFGQS